MGLLDCRIATAMTVFDKAAKGGAYVLLCYDCVWQWIVGSLDCGIAGL